jgi:hypothetical protein
MHFQPGLTFLKENIKYLEGIKLIEKDFHVKRIWKCGWMKGKCFNIQGKTGTKFNKYVFIEILPSSWKLFDTNLNLELCFSSLKYRFRCDLRIKEGFKGKNLNIAQNGKSKMKCCLSEVFLFRSKFISFYSELIIAHLIISDMFTIKIKKRFYIEKSLNIH